MTTASHAAAADQWTADRLRDAARLDALRRTALLDSAPEEAFDRLTRLATAILKTPVALVSLVAGDRQVFKSSVGLPEPWASARETPLSHSFCQHVTATNEPLLVGDARAHPLVSANLAIRDLGVVSYAGVPLVTSDGVNLGSFCVADTVPRAWTDQEVAILKDLTAAALTEIELRLAARALAESEAFSRSIFESSPDCVKVLDRDARLHAMNGPGLCLMEIDRFEQFAGSDWVAFWQEGDRLTVLAAVETARAGRTGEFEAFCPTAKGTPKWWHVLVSPIFDDHGKVVQLVSISRDITARKQAELERDELLAREQEARHATEEAIRTRDAILATVAHDLKNPLTAVRGQAELIQRQAARIADGDLGRPILRGAGRIQTVASRMATLIDELLDVAQLRVGQPLRLHRAPTDLVALARQVVAQYHDTSDRHQVGLESSLAELVGAWDHSRLERVLDNLVNNAVKYSPNGGPVTVGVARDGDRAVVTVRDAGVGIPAGDLPRIFEPFHRAGNAEARAGNGLGLWGASRIVRQHGGTIDAASREGAGTTMTVRLPLRGDAGAAPPAERP